MEIFNDVCAFAFIHSFICIERLCLVPLQEKYSQNLRILLNQNITQYQYRILLLNTTQYHYGILHNITREQALSQPPIHPSFGRVKIDLDGLLWMGCCCGRANKLFVYRCVHDIPFSDPEFAL